MKPLAFRRSLQEVPKGPEPPKDRRRKAAVWAAAKVGFSRLSVFVSPEPIAFRRWTFSPIDARSGRTTIRRAHRSRTSSPVAVEDIARLGVTVMGAPSSSEGREDPPRERQQGRTALPVPSGRFQLGTAAGLRKRRCAAGSSPCRRRRSADPARAGLAAAAADGVAV